MRKDIKRYIQYCDSCQRVKIPMKYGKLNPIPTGAQFDMLGIDSLGPFPRTDNNNTFVIVIMDFATRYAITAAVEADRRELIIKVLEDVFLTYGFPHKLLTDNGSA